MIGLGTMKPVTCPECGPQSMLGSLHAVGCSRSTVKIKGYDSVIPDGLANRMYSPPRYSPPRYTCPHCDWAGSNDHAVWMAHHCSKPLAALAHQEGGGHYKDMKIQPVEFIHANGIPFIEGSVIKYVSRWRAKGGVEDLKKARHFIDLLIDLEGKAP